LVIAIVAVIAGNPKTNRLGLVIAIALILLIVLGAWLLGTRKRTNPQPAPPLHPSSVVHLAPLKMPNLPETSGIESSTRAI
jgi:hypothetical protein